MKIFSVFDEFSNKLILRKALIQFQTTLEDFFTLQGLHFQTSPEAPFLGSKVQ